MDPLTLLPGTANPALARTVADELGLRPGRCAVDRFPDGETSVRLKQPVVDRRILIIQPVAPPVNDNLMELLAMSDACRRAGAYDITAIVPYLGYARADSRGGKREPVTARIVADQIQAAGVDRLVTVDLHTPALEGFFTIPVEHLSAVGLFVHALDDRLARDAVVVSPDLGRIETAVEYGDRMDRSTAVLGKRRRSGTEVEVTELIGDVRDRPCLIIDDMISTGGTIVEAVRALVEAGARPDMIVAATHGLFVGGARDRLDAAGVRAVWVTDSIAQAEHASDRVQVVSIAPLLADAVRRLFGLEREI